MALASVLHPHSVLLQTARIAHLTDLTLSHDRQVVAEGATGYAPARTYVAAAGTRITATTKSIRALLGILGSLGTTLTSNAKATWQQGLNGAGRGTGGSEATIATGMALPRSLSAPHGQDASMSFEIVGLSSDGKVAPYSLGSVTVPALSEAEVLTLYRLTIGGVVIDCPQGVTVDFGLSERTLGGGGDIYSTIGEVQTVAPTISATTLDAAVLSSLFGAAVGGNYAGLGTRAAVVVELAPRVLGGGLDLANLVTLTVTNAHVSVQNLGNSGEMAIHAVCEWAGTAGTSPLSIGGLV